MQQKVQFIVTVLHQPKLLIFDEPFSGFDPINANLLKAEILKLRDEGSTIIFSTHNMASVEELCDHIALINRSKKILEGEINQIRSQYKENLYEIIFASPFNKMNVAMNSDYEIAEIRKNADSTHTLRLRLKKDITTNELLQGIFKGGNILSFKEVIPSMNDVFIKAVEENKQQETA